MSNIVDNDINGINYTSAKTLGFVTITEEDLSPGKLGIYIPTHLTKIGGGNSEVNAEMRDSIFANDSSCPITVNKSVKQRNYMEVEYIGGSNMTLPKIAKGEPLYIYFIDGDIKRPRFTLEKTDQTLRKTEKLKYFINAKSSVDDPDSEEYEYGIIMDSDDMYMKLYTAANNGEVCVWNILADGKNGTISLGDDKGNAVTIDSNNDSITQETAQGGKLSLVGRDFTADVGKWTINADEILLDAKMGATIQAAMDLILKGLNINETATVGWNVNAVQGNVTTTAMMNIIAPAIALGGGVLIGGPLTMAPPVPGAAPTPAPPGGSSMGKDDAVLGKKVFSVAMAEPLIAILQALMMVVRTESAANATLISNTQITEPMLQAIEPLLQQIKAKTVKGL